jgi:hypothetical protein
VGGLRRSVLALLVLGTIVGGLLLLPNVQTADPVGSIQLSAGWPFASAREMEPVIARVFACTLEQTPRTSQCLSSRTHGLVSIDIDPMHGKAVKFTSMVLISRDDAPRPEEERDSINTVTHLMDYFFPDWVERRTWISLALQQARDRHANSTIELGDTILSVEWEIPLGFPEQSTFAFITVEQAVSSFGIDNRPQ